MKKKITRITVFLLAFLLALGFALPFLMENKVGDLLKSNINDNIHGNFDFSGISLSIYKEFPNAVVVLRDVNLINKEPFLGDTLFTAEFIQLRMGIGEFFEGAADPLEINEFIIDSAGVYLKINKEGVANYQIGRDGTQKEEKEKSEDNTVLSIRSYQISNTEFSYSDAESETSLLVEEFNHSGSGDLSSSRSQLETQSEALISLTVEQTSYLERNPVNLKALLGVDIESQTISFEENEAVINRLPISFDGSMRLMEEGQDFDLAFNTVNSDFKNFLALIPEHYSGDISKLQTKGNFEIAGQFKGELTEETIPGFQISMKAQDASFKYPELPRKVENIHIDARIENTTGIPADTEIEIGEVSFQIDRDTFEIRGKIAQLSSNISVDSRVKGSIDLNKLSEAYPVPESVELGGKLRADIKSAFRLNDIEQKNYKKIDLSGDLEVAGLRYNFESLPSPVKVHTLRADLGSRTIDIKEVAGITGTTDFSASGKLRNTLGYLFNEEVLKGNFEMRSNAFVLADLLGEESVGEDGEATEDEEAFKIPANLDINIDALVGKAVYDNIVLYDLVGNLRIRNEQIAFSEISSRMLDGRMILDGTVSTQNEVPDFSFAFNMSKLNIAKAFQSLDLMKMVSPAASALDGRFSTKMQLSGKLTDRLDLDLSSVTGNILAEILAATVSPDKAPVLDLVDNKLGFVALDKMDISGLKTALSLENGRVNVKPFTIRYEDVSMQVSGGHSFANNLDYELKFDVPAEYLGDDVNKLLASISDPSLGEIHIPVIARLNGSYDNPALSSDVKSQTRVLTDQLVEIQKQKYINQGKTKVNELIGNVLTDASDPKQDKDEQGASSSALSEALQNIPKTSVDTTKVTDSDSTSEGDVKKAANSLSNGLLGSKEKAVTAKDTLNR